MMSKVKDFFAHPLIQIALATGVSILALAWFFKKVVGHEVPAKYAAIPGLMLCFYEYARVKKWKWMARTWIPVTAILVSTALIIFFHVI